MAVKYEKKRNRKNNILYTVVSAVLLCAVFLTMVGHFYTVAENEAYEELHVQTKQIKDDLTLQIKSDRENLVTMANFAAKLYADGESYSRMFDSFEPIGLFSRIGILNPDGVFITKDGTVNISDKLSFEEQALLGEHITGRTISYSIPDEQVVRSSVPIKVNGETVGIMYGIIRIETINNKYNSMAKELDAQLFVFDKESGKFVIDTINKKPAELSWLKNREYNDEYSYEDLVTTDKGYSSFKSILTGEDLYVHYSTLEDFNWGIMLARYESQVFEETHAISQILLMSFSAMVVIMFLYVLMIMTSEKRRSSAMSCASTVRKLLLEINQRQENILAALKEICLFGTSRSAIFFDTGSKDYHYIMPSYEKYVLLDKDREYFKLQLMRYATEIHKTNHAAVNIMCITPNSHLVKTNPDFYDFLKKHGIFEISFATVVDKNNHISILGVVNPKRSKATRMLLEDVAVCFSIAFYNQTYLNKTELAAITDALTGALNRVAYKRDLREFDKKRPEKFSCVYIDVNELHFRNNKYGHAAGDEMLLYISNTLKEVFYGHKVYRMGGDEFLVFTQNTEQEDVKKCVELFIEQLVLMEYHVAIGMSFRTQNTNTEEMVREAELRMYEAKAQYYQNKEQQSFSKSEDKGYVQIKTGILEIDTMLSVLKEHYNGIYRVSLDSDKAHRILMPAYLGYNEDEEHFSSLLNKYICETVSPDFHRAVMSFLNYDAIKSQLIEGKTPKITYKKMNGEVVILSVYKLDDKDAPANNTLWVFAKD